MSNCKSQWKYLKIKVVKLNIKLNKKIKQKNTRSKNGEILKYR